MSKSFTLERKSRRKTRWNCPHGSQIRCGSNMSMANTAPMTTFTGMQISDNPKTLKWSHCEADRCWRQWSTTWIWFWQENQKRNFSCIRRYLFIILIFSKLFKPNISARYYGSRASPNSSSETRGSRISLTRLRGYRNPWAVDDRWGRPFHTCKHMFSLL